MGIVAIDLGTTNIKVIAYDDALKPKAERSKNVEYIRRGATVEFDAEAYFDIVAGLIGECGAAAFSSSPAPVRQIVLTGQAESLVCVDKNGRTVRNAISWLDNRSVAQCETLRGRFSVDESYRITGQPDIIPTWPATKILWIKENEPDNFPRVYKFLLLKDYIQYRLCGEFAAEHNIYNFSHYFDIVNKKYWGGMLDFLGISEAALPTPVAPCSVIGKILPQVAAQLGISPDAKINAGTLDHFAGMIGTGNIRPGIISESTGTVLALATLIDAPAFSDDRIPQHCGPFNGSYVFLPVCESGGISLEWFKKTFADSVSFADIDIECAKRAQPGNIVFLPYITGVNAPDFNTDASGVFFGFKAENDKFDFALAVMEGVANMLHINIAKMAEAGVHAERIISTGGGAKSALWCQMKADITQHAVAVPKNKEAACLGAAMIGAVSEGLFCSYDEAVDSCVSMEKEYAPALSPEYAKKRELYRSVYGDLKSSFALQSGKSK